MSPSESIIVKIRTNQPKYFTNIAQHINFLNHILEKYPNPLFYLEIVEDGILQIFKNFDSFKHVHLPVHPNFINKIKQMSPDQNFLLKGIDSKDGKPESGMILTVECIVEYSADLFPIMKRFYDSLHPQIQLSMQENMVTIDMKVFEAFLIYANLIYANIELNQ